tara:strand:+ start:2764 stop:2898 length:135 start_codon:yes stop_codon:yes gene_type:complete
MPFVSSFYYQSMIFIASLNLFEVVKNILKYSSKKQKTFLKVLKM